MASQAADTSPDVGAFVKSVGQPDAGKPHVRLDEGAPVVEGVTRDRALLYTCHYKPFLCAQR